MLDKRHILSGTWITVMLLYLAGDVLRIYSGDSARMEAASPSDPSKWLFAAIFLFVPVMMGFQSLVLARPISRWLNIIVAIVYFGFVLIDQDSFPSAYDKFLLFASMGFNVLTVWYAWHWTAALKP
jgi:hypothetical protein